MKNKIKSRLTNLEEKLLADIEAGGKESLEHNAFIYCYLDSKRNGCNNFDERLKQVGQDIKKESQSIQHIPAPPTPPLDRVMKDGVTNFCKHCGSTVSKNGLLGLFGEMLCHNQQCPNSKSAKFFR
jgi:hypothetical protein